jgi:hypothetical protein
VVSEAPRHRGHRLSGDVPIVAWYDLRSLQNFDLSWVRVVLERSGKVFLDESMSDGEHPKSLFFNDHLFLETIDVWISLIARL